MTAPEPATWDYVERLRVPVHWWLTPVFFVVVLGYGLFLFINLAVAVAGTVVFVAAVVTGLVRYGALPLVVGTDGFRAGSAFLPLAAISAVYPLDKAQAFALRGPRADARARIVLRGYVAAAVRIDVTDPARPEPYWYVSTREPHALAKSLTTARDRAAPPGP